MPWRPALVHQMKLGPEQEQQPDNTEQMYWDTSLLNNNPLKNIVLVIKDVEKNEIKHYCIYQVLSIFFQYCPIKMQGEIHKTF